MLKNKTKMNSFVAFQKQITISVKGKCRVTYKVFESSSVQSVVALAWTNHM